LVLTAKRPIHSLALVLALFSVIRVLFHFSLPILSFVFIFLSFAIALWWLSELLYISIPWERILTEMDKEPRDPFDTLARIKLKYEDLSQKYNDMKKSTDPVKQMKRNCGILMGLSLVSYFLPTELLCYSLVYGSFVGFYLIDKEWQRLRNQQKKDL